MLDILRANTRSVLTYVLFGIIIVVFVVSFGPGSRGCAETGGSAALWAAEVGGDRIGAPEYLELYGRLYRTYQARFGAAFTPELAEQLGLRNQALQQLVDRELVLIEARRHGVVVTDDELSRAIQQVPAFQVDGRFDMELYKRAVAASYGSPTKFEAQLRRDLEYQKTLGLVGAAVKVPDDEVREAWLADNDRASLEFVRFPLSAARAEVKVTDAEAQAFAAANGARIEQYYKDNASRYQTKKRVRARHILVKVPENAQPAEEEAAHKRTEEVWERLKKGEDFAALARQYSDDPGSRDRGGELGFFGEGVMAKPFEDAAFALPPGQLSAPIRTRFGWHILQVEEVKAPESIPLEKARLAIAREILEQDGARKVASRRAEEALRRLEAGKRVADLFPAADPGKKVQPAKLGGEALAVESTGPFGRGDLVPLVGRAPQLAADAFAADGGQVLRKVYDSPSGPLVAVVKERRRPDPSRFAEQREAAARRLRNRREADVEEAWLKSLREKAKVKVNDALLRGAPIGPPADLE